MEWNILISDDKKLSTRRNTLNPYEPIKSQYSFGDNLYYCDGICTVVDKTIVSDWARDEIRVFCQRGQSSFTFGFRGTQLGKFRDPSGLCIVEGDLWIADRENKRIQIFDITNWTPTGFICLGKHMPARICVLPNGLVGIVTAEGAILITSQDGHIIKEFGSHGKGNGEFDLPTGICCNSKGEIFIVDNRNHRVQVFCLDGTFLRTIGCLEKGPGKLCCPTQICADECDNIFVIDAGNHRISIVNSEGLLVQQISQYDANDLVCSGRQLIVISKDAFVEIFSN